MVAKEAEVSVQIAGTARGWLAASQGQALPLSIALSGPSGAAFPKLPGWKAPLWRPEGALLLLLRPEGLWRAHHAGLPERFALRERGAGAWSGARGLPIDLSRRLPEGVWLDQQGLAQSPWRMDREAAAPPELAGRAEASGGFARWELTEDGRALGWLDDSFERGPFSAQPRAPWLVVSDGSRKVAYWMGPTHWAWAFVERGMFSLRVGRGGGWEQERDYKPVVF